MKFTFIILEDDERDYKNIVSFLKDLEYPSRILSRKDLQSASLPPTDVVIAGLSGIDQSEKESLIKDLREIRARCPQSQIILCAPYGLRNLDSITMEIQARSLLLKPLDKETFTSLLNKTLAIIRKRKLRTNYARGSRKTSRITEITGESEKIRNVLSLLEKVSGSRDTSVLLLGESGTGKSLFARAIHDMSARSSGPFIEINCATLPPNLLESELFGYEPGAFTDAKKEKMGLIELADDGTLFLDEISEVDFLTQAKLLKFLDSKKIRRLGGSKDIRVDARVIAASNRDLKDEVRRREFREDLFYRLNVVEVYIPPLRERREDILHIAAYYMNEFKKKFNKPKLGLAEDSLELLKNYDWPGNVRELINVIERAVILAQGDMILPGNFPIHKTTRKSTVVISGEDEDINVHLPEGGVRLETLEKKVIEETLKRTRGNVLKASRMLGIKRGALRYKLAKYNIDPSAFSRIIERAGVK